MVELYSINERKIMYGLCHGSFSGSKATGTCSS